MQDSFVKQRLRVDSVAPFTTFTEDINESLRFRSDDAHANRRSYECNELLYKIVHET